VTTVPVSPEALKPWHRWLVQIRPMRLGRWMPFTVHTFRWMAYRQAEYATREYKCEARVIRPSEQEE
jgi:hypothetical protein